ncbi:hypothetical protein Pen01_70300 [Phytomonospora endophytica]|nr:hypothetical protein Pen01_70300 [Phytomonospora endophytica]
MSERELTLRTYHLRVVSALKVPDTTDPDKDMAREANAIARRNLRVSRKAAWAAIASAVIAAVVAVPVVLTWWSDPPLWRSVPSGRPRFSTAVPPSHVTTTARAPGTASTSTPYRRAARGRYTW